MKKRGALFLILTVAVIVAFVSPRFYFDAVAQNSSGTSASSMITLESGSNRVLFQKNADQRRPMASTTKIVTAITVLELCRDIEEIVAIPKEAVGVEGSSIYLQQNERLSIKDLLYGLMLQSGNDCAVALAHAVSGSVSSFSIEMNNLAKKAGAMNSNFVNPHGLHHDNHYTTARDLALISSYAMKNATFKEIVGTKKYVAPWQGRDYNRVILNKNRILSSFEGGNGIKTGYTKKAGRCLVSASERDGMQIIAVVLNCGPMFEDCMALMKRAYNSYIMTDIITKSNELFQAKVEKSQKNTVKIGSARTVSYPLSDGEINNIKCEFEINSTLTAPVRIGQEVGVIKIYLGNQLLFIEKLYTIEDAKPLSVKDYLKDLVERWNE